MTNIILPSIILCNYGNGKYKLPMYCLYIILRTHIIGSIIFSKVGFEPRLWAFSCCKPSPSPIQARKWAGPVLRGLWARPSTSLCWIAAYIQFVVYFPQLSDIPFLSRSSASHINLELIVVIYLLGSAKKGMVKPVFIHMQ